ncbi:LysE family translocator, partial [Klebsiella pneumoniae]
ASAVRTMIGGNLASLLLLAAAAAMLTGALAVEPRALTLLAMIGSLYIIWLALAMLREDAVTQQVAKKRSGVMAGFATALSNPKDILFFAAFFPQFIHITDS